MLSSVGHINSASQPWIKGLRQMPSQNQPTDKTLQGLVPTPALATAIQAETLEHEGEDVPIDERIGPLPKKIVFRIQDESGDKRLIWDLALPETVKEAQKKFYELIKEGYKIFAVLANGKRSTERLLRFDPRVEEVICVPGVTGG